MRLNIKSLSIMGDQVAGSGWVLPKNPADTINLALYDSYGNSIPSEFIPVKHTQEEALPYTDQPTEAYSYTFSYDKEASAPITCIFSSNENPSDNKSVGISDDQKIIATGHFKTARKLGGIAKNFVLSDNKLGYMKSIYLQIPCFKHLSYNIWLKEHQASKEDLKKQSETEFPYMPLISIIVPVYNPNPKHLCAMIESVKKQSYENWQLCLANGSGDNMEICRILHAYAAKDSRIRNGRLRKNRGISGNSNAALKLATGEWIALADQDDLLEPDALYEYVKAMNTDENIDVIYCDEDKLDDKKKLRMEPHFKSDFNIDLLTCNNYICHMLMARRTLIDKVGGFDPAFDGAQDHDLTFRLVENCRRVYHVPRILYTWRVHEASTSGNASSKDYAFDAGAAAINAHYKRMGIPGKARRVELLGWYTTSFTIENPPLVSVIIPNMDHRDDLKRCVSSILTRASYKNIEIIIVENNSVEPETFELYKELQDGDARVRVITWKDEFNYSAINNFGVKNANGEYVLLLNNDTELITPDFFESMLGYCMRPDVGAVGAKLYYGDDTIQHAGLLIGVMHGCHHVFLHYPKKDYGYMGRAIASQDMSGVTGACLMVSKEIYESVGGLDKDFTVAYNDVDFCLKVEKAGYLNVFDAFAQMYHYESKSRGYELSREANERFEHEKKHLDEKWYDRLEADPYYNVNLSLVNGYYRLP